MTAKEARDDLVLEFQDTLVSANIPTEKIDHPKLRNFLKTRVANGGSVLLSIPLRKRLPELFRYQLALKGYVQRRHSFSGMSLEQDPDMLLPQATPSRDHVAEKGPAARALPATCKRTKTTTTASSPSCYKKSRKAGIPVVFAPVDPQVSLLNTDPNLIAAQILKSTQKRVRNHRFSKNGSLTVTVASLQAAKALLGVTCLGNNAVTTQIPESYARNVEKIVGVNSSCTDPQCWNTCGPTRTQTTSSVVVTFKSDIAMPEEMPLGFNKFKVSEYFSPTQCYRCQGFGHVAKYYRRSERCRACAGSHAFKDCTTRKEQRCANCGGPHPTSFGGCPKRKVAIAAVKTDACEVPSSHSGRINPAVVKPTRPAPVRSADAFLALPKPAAPAKKPAGAKPVSGKCSDTNATPSVWDLPRDPAPTKRQPPPAADRAKRTTPAPPKPAVQEAAAKPEPAPPQGTQLVMMLVPLLITAFHAMLAAIPAASNIPEVQAFKVMEPMLASLLSILSVMDSKPHRSQQPPAPAFPRVLQWNCAGLRPRLAELKQRLTKTSCSSSASRNATSRTRWGYQASSCTPLPAYHTLVTAARRSSSQGSWHKLSCPQTSCRRPWSRSQLQSSTITVDRIPDDFQQQVQSSLPGPLWRPQRAPSALGFLRR
ncbi:uncharacterized protein LOC135392575 [Ornithodoros turicata]|uniref:uncharacterized protein LOC135392575 n=1 Tax=Ornithodoros turicata TaxID=34597 RepID=UPI0031399EF8